MRIHALFVTRTYETSTPELADAWDEYCIDSNPDGFDKARKNAATDDEVQAFAEVIFEVDEQAVMNALYPALVVVPAEIVEG
jgi:hypothetical protein